MITDNWILYTLIATLLWSITAIIDKFILTKITQNEYIPLFFSSVIGVITAIIIFFILATESISYYGYHLPLAAGLLYGIAGLFYFKAVKKKEISRVIALWNTAPIITAILAIIFIGEVVTINKYLAVLALVLGVYILESKDYWFSFTAGAKLILFSTVLVSIHYILIKLAFNQIDNFFIVFALVRIGYFIATLPLFLINKQQISKFIYKLDRKTFIILVSSESLTTLGNLSITIAASTGYITLVNGLSSLQPLVVLILAAITTKIFRLNIKERLSVADFKRKFVAIIIIMTGLLLIA